MDLRIEEQGVLGGMLMRIEVKEGGKLRIIEHTKKATEKSGKGNNANLTQNTLSNSEKLRKNITVVTTASSLLLIGGREI